MIPLFLVPGMGFEPTSYSPPASKAGLCSIRVPRRKYAQRDLNPQRNIPADFESAAYTISAMCACIRRDSNPQSFRLTGLNRVCIPVPPLIQRVYNEIRTRDPQIHNPLLFHLSYIHHNDPYRN